MNPRLQTPVPAIQRLPARDFFALAAFALLVLTPGTFAIGLFDRDEGWYAQVAREMNERNEWIVPSYLGEPWIGKPPLLYWLIAASYRIFGVSGGAARLVSVLAMSGAVLLIARLTAPWYGRRAAWIAAVSFITAALPCIVGKMVLTDSLMLLCCLGAVAAYVEMLFHGVSANRSAAFWLLIGLGFLAKGPAILLFAGGFTAAALIVQRSGRGAAAGLRHAPLRSRGFWTGSVLGVALGGWWYVIAAAYAGDTLWRQFVLFEIASRFVDPPHGHAGPPGYYAVISLAALLPWSALVPGALLGAWASRKVDPAARLLVLWCALPWIVLELIPSKLPHYALPCYVPVVMLLGRMWEEGFQRAVTQHERRVLYLWSGTPIVLGAAIIITALHAPGAVRAPLAVTGFALTAAFAFVASLLRQRQFAASLGAAVAGTAFAVALACFWLGPALEPYRLSRIAADRVNELLRSDNTVIVCGYEEPTLFFYMRARAEVVSPQNLASRAEALNTPAIWVLSSSAFERLTLISPQFHDDSWIALEGINYANGRWTTVMIGSAEPAGPGMSNPAPLPQAFAGYSPRASATELLRPFETRAARAPPIGGSAFSATSTRIPAIQRRSALPTSTRTGHVCVSASATW